MTQVVKQSAVKKLERSQLNPAAIQRELMGDDLDLTKLVLYLKRKIQFNAVESVIDIVPTRTVEGASSIDITLLDAKRDILKSGILNNKLDVQIDGLWFRLVKVEKQGDNIILTFEDREIAILRTYKKHKIAHRDKVTRAEFINNLIREVKEFHIPVVIPELHQVEAIEKSKDISNFSTAVADKSGGVPESEANKPLPHLPEGIGRNSPRPQRLTVKGTIIDRDQLKYANIITAVGQNMGARRKVLVAAIMTAIQESTLRNLPYGDRDSLGLFQQRASWGSATARLDPATSSRMFFNRAIVADNEDPTRPYWDICQVVQRSAFPDAYAQWRTEAERIISAYGLPGGDTTGSAAEANLSAASLSDGSNYIYYRGVPVDGGKTWKPEDSWTCISRLSSEVAWRAFFVSGVFYYIAEDDLFKSKPVATIKEFDEGIESIDGDYDTGKMSATVTITARVGTWLIPPGAIIILEEMGAFDGRWLVNTFSRSLFDSVATITLKKPRPRLPEPLLNDINQIPTWAASTSPTVPSYSQTGGFTNPLPTKMTDTSEFAVPDAQGAPARTGIRYHAGKDWFAPGGTVVVAPIAGTLVEVKQSTGNSGQIFGGVVKLQQDNGYVWVFRHVAPLGPKIVGARIQEGEPIATVVEWADNPSSSHAHIEIWRTLAGGYVYENMIDPVKYIKGQAQ